MKAFFACAILSAGFAALLHQVNGQNDLRSRRNIIVFVADGLRPDSVTADDTPALWSIRQQGVNFVNSHSVFPTFTMANASVVATGHGLGDTGVFSNVIWTGYATYSGTPVPFLENDQMLIDIRGHFTAGLPTETTILGLASQSGYNTASIGKVGPTALVNSSTPAHLIIDDSTGNTDVFPLPTSILDEINRAGLATAAPTRSNGYGPTAPWNNGYAGTAKEPGARQANIVQQRWFADVATRVVLPMFGREAPTPFMVLYWSRDPDGTQHNHGDSLGSLSPGINGETSRQAVRNADANLKQILDWLDSNPAIKANTDVFITSDHGFATISKREVAVGKYTTSETATHEYVDGSGNVDTLRGMLPYGFLAIDLAKNLRTGLFDPDRRAAKGSGDVFREISLGPDVFEHPVSGNGFLGQEIRNENGSDALAIIAANGGSDLIYVPNKNVGTVKSIVSLLATMDYVGGIFVDDAYGPVPGALALSAIGLTGASSVRRPDIVVAFKVFYLSPGNLMSAVQISDASQQHGQGMHGGIGRENTFNNMAAIGPDFKIGFVDQLPVSNADIVPTIAHILGLHMPSTGKELGRVALEALRGDASAPIATAHRLESTSADGRRTIIHFQELNGIRYLDRGCFVAASLTCP